ncbi:MAG: glycosyltransferase family 39 protein [Lachnospiraceae bacterium]|nr:glycosyltransferase family 39 protein [Lachnospiraceae bacterium]
MRKERYLRKKKNMGTDPVFLIFLIFSVIIPGLYAGILYNQTMPFAEGWYTYYAQCINDGLMPYRDFEYLFSPVYIYFIALVTRIFGYKIIVLRVLGVLFFCIISALLYILICNILETRNKYCVAFIAAATAVFYLQSEVVQIFYDYIRMMDIFAILSVLFLVKTVKTAERAESCTRDLLLCGLFTGLFINVKQNMGLVFLAYAFILLIYVGLYMKKGIKETGKALLLFLAPIAVLTGIIYAFLFSHGALSAYLQSTGAGAVSTKGGMAKILFGWIVNNSASFIRALPFAVIGLCVICLLLFRNEKRKDQAIGGHLDSLYGIAFFLAAGALILLLAFQKSFAYAVSFEHYPSPYLLFLIVFPLFVFWGVCGIADMIRGSALLKKYMLYFVVAGSYFAIAFGCGTSGGLAEGQSSLGVALLVTLLFTLLAGGTDAQGNNKAEKIVKGAVSIACLFLVLQCADKKMINTYYWWGMDESDFWSNTAVSDIPLLEGIGLSAETKEVYEGIYDAIVNHTEEDDAIFCFPQIPIFYSLCDRTDPGTTTKVQWFDVSTDESIEEDIEYLKENLPKAIILYNTTEETYDSHESAFRNGEVSGTREMREFLYNLVYEYDYTFYGRYEANSNVIQVWILEEDGYEAGSTTEVFAGGSGTYEDPYLIETADQLMLFARMVNEGRSFEGSYIRQTADIDLEGYDWVPIGEYGSGAYFYGTYDGAGHVIRNMTFDDSGSNGGLFGALAGEVYNLGLEGGLINGNCAGGDHQPLLWRKRKNCQLLYGSGCFRKQGRRHCG